MHTLWIRMRFLAFGLTSVGMCFPSGSSFISRNQSRRKQSNLTDWSRQNPGKKPKLTANHNRALQNECPKSTHELGEAACFKACACIRPRLHQRATDRRSQNPRELARSIFSTLTVTPTIQLWSSQFALLQINHSINE